MRYYLITLDDPGAPGVDLYWKETGNVAGKLQDILNPEQIQVDDADITIAVNEQPSDNDSEAILAEYGWTLIPPEQEETS